jgi:hypothetical protein
MHDQPTPTPEEEERAASPRQEDEEAMRYPGHEDPPQPADGTADPQDESEIHDA